MLDLIVIDGKARGIVTRNLVTGEIEYTSGRRGGAGHRRLRQRLLPLDQREGLERTAIWRAYKTRRAVRQSLLHADPSDLHSGIGRLSIEADADERIAAQRRPHLGALRKGDKRRPDQIPEEERDYYLERRYPSFGNLVPRDVASRNAKAVCDEGRGVGETGLGVYLDFADAIQRLGENVISERYGNLFDMYQRITGREIPTRCRCASIRRFTTRWAGCGWITS